jgi:Rrf2 family protein
MLSFSRKADYGLLFLTVLAQSTDAEYVSVRAVAKKHVLPYTFLAKIASELHEMGVIESREGVRGGFRLKLAPDAISLGSVVAKLDGPVAPVACMQGKACVCQASCSHQGMIQSVSRLVEQTMADYTLKDLLGGTK